MEAADDITISVSDTQYLDKIASMKSDCALVELPDITGDIVELIEENATIYSGYSGFYGESIDATNNVCVNGTVCISGPIFAETA